MAHPEGFEPPTKWFEATYSIQLSYGCVFKVKIIASTSQKTTSTKPPATIDRNTLAQP